MKKSKEKRIKALKKIHVLPHILLLCIFMIFLTVIIVAFEEMFVSFLVEKRLEGPYQSVQIFSEMIEEQIKDTDDITSINIDKWDSVDYALYDNTTEEFVVKPKQEISLTNCIVYEFYDNTVYFDKINGDGMGGAGEEEATKLLSEIYKSLQTADFSELTGYEINQREMVRVHGWIEQDVMEGKYNLYYSTDVILSTKDMIYVVTFIVMLLVSVAVPLILYIIVLILGTVGQKRAARLLYYDAVTGGRNWLHFSERAVKIIKKCKRGKRHYAMVSLRMDRYQGYCACYGTKEGEVAVERINRIIGKAVKKNEMYARYSEAEFGLLLLMDTQEQIIDRVKELKEQLVMAMEPHKIDFSAGLCEVTYGVDVDELYSNASLARKSIPDNATVRIQWFDEKLKKDQLWERFVEENMEHALEAGELHVYLQPKYHPQTGRLGGAEALIRWISPTEGFIGPGRFIPIFEKNGFITKIDDFMLRSIARLQAQWVKEGRNVVPISVNVSRAHFTQEDLAEHICEIVESEGAPKELIELELTESAFFEDKDVLINTVEKLKSMGFVVSMDDFGAGYSSLNSLKDLQLDVLKIDADFFRGREKNEERGSLIVFETIQLAKHLGMTTVAEGIESADQVDFLAKNGCDLIQGFYFAKPMPIVDYEEKMKEDAEKN